MKQKSAKISVDVEVDTMGRIRSKMSFWVPIDGAGHQHICRPEPHVAAKLHHPLPFFSGAKGAEVLLI